MNLITREIINKNLVVKSLFYSKFNNSFTLEELNYQQLIDYIDRAKTYLILEKNCQVGDKVLLASNQWPEYLVWFFAVSELGMSFIVSDYPALDNSLSVANKLSLYGKIDHIIGEEHSRNIFLLPDNYQKSLITWDCFRHYENKECKNLIRASPQDILLYSTSSGTTSTPKIIKHTHEFFYNLLERNARLYNLKELDRCLHTKGLHHGSVTGVYFLPTIKYCSYHYYAKITIDCTTPGTSTPQNWVDMLQKENINRCLMFYDMIDNFCDLASLESKKHDNHTAFVLAKINQKHLNIIVKKFGYKIVSIFGCTETSGPLFLPEININNVDSYNLDNFGPVLDNFYKISVDDENNLTVEMPNGEKILTGDKFFIVKNNFIFHGRENLYRINGRAFYLNLLIQVVEQITGLKNLIDFDIVVDQEFNQIYIRLDNDKNLEKLNARISKKIKGDTSYQIRKKIVAPRELFFNGIKFDSEEVRLRCRSI